MSVGLRACRGVDIGLLRIPGVSVGLIACPGVSVGLITCPGVSVGLITCPGVSLGFLTSPRGYDVSYTHLGALVLTEEHVCRHQIEKKIVRLHLASTQIQ